MWLESMILVDGAVHFQYWISELDRSRADGEVHLTQRIELMR
jgi:hypothetical protein